MSVSFAWDRYSEFPTPPIFDLSEKDVVYNFNKDGFMYISGETAELDLGSDTEQDCWDLYLRYGIRTWGYAYTTKISWETVSWENGWCWWSVKIGDNEYGLTASEEKSQMRITKVFPYNELPWINMRTSPGPSAWFEIHFEKVVE